MGIWYCHYVALGKCVTSKIRWRMKQTMTMLSSGSFTSCCLSRIQAQENRTLRDIITFRKWQAQRSVLIEVSQSNSDYVHDLCKTFGEVKDFLPYENATGKNFCVVEFSALSGIDSLLKKCSYRGPCNGIPVFSSFLYYKPEDSSLCPADVSSPECPVHRNINFDPENIHNMSESMQLIKFYEQERLSDVDIRLRFIICSVVESFLSGVLPFCKVIPHESTINGFGCRSSCLNMLLNIYPKIDDATSAFEFSTQKVMGFYDCPHLHVLNTIGDILNTFFPSISNVHKKLRSKLPLITFHSDILGVNCDIALNDTSLIYLSELLFLCGEFDSRVRPLILILKSWASETSITSHDEKSWINDISLTLMVIFFLQSRPIPVLPPLCQIEQHGTKQDSKLRNVETLDTLLKEFFVFLGNFPFKRRCLSAYNGKSYMKPDFSPLCIQNPINHQINASENVSQEQLDHLREAACRALWNFEALSKISNYRTV